MGSLHGPSPKAPPVCRAKPCRYINSMQMQRSALEAEADRGVSALQSGDFAAARRAFDILTQSGSASPQAWLFLAQACDGLDDRASALAALDQVLAADKVN